MDSYIIIGGMGSGKSTVARMLAERGAAHLDLDAVGHTVLASGLATDALVGAFGGRILDDDGAVGRKALARCAFRDEASTAILNDIMHPLIVAEAQAMLQAFERTGSRMAVVEVSAYAGPGGAFDGLVRDARGVVAVAAPRSMRAQRAVQQGFGARDVRNRLRRQPTERARAQWASAVVPNVRTLDDLEKRVDELWARLNGSERR